MGPGPSVDLYLWTYNGPPVDLWVLDHQWTSISGPIMDHQWTTSPSFFFRTIEEFLPSSFNFFTDILLE
ncbi:ORF 68 [Sulfolobus spindle-shaped virus 2]|uniref:Fuselloviral protein SSV2p05 n=2 Tax=root TaxID=1 RepID=A0A157T063_SACSO|nr:ORF 68 [Sulfolobus spindle-shaped virus 2]AAQ73252.1 ORF 68 [Sulfolobus spindle-shaped virus 2]SAI84261.1 Fuselloviral protein SSV2p05 [Saccharolobus solfataricus]